MWRFVLASKMPNAKILNVDIALSCRKNCLQNKYIEKNIEQVYSPYLTSGDYPIDKHKVVKDLLQIRQLNIRFLLCDKSLCVFYCRLNRVSKPKWLMMWLSWEMRIKKHTQSGKMRQNHYEHTKKTFIYALSEVTIRDETKNELFRFKEWIHVLL